MVVIELLVVVVLVETCDPLWVTELDEDVTTVDELEVDEVEVCVLLVVCVVEVLLDRRKYEPEAAIMIITTITTTTILVLRPAFRDTLFIIPLAFFHTYSKLAEIFSKL